MCVVYSRSLTKWFMCSRVSRVACCEVPCNPAEHINAMHVVTLPKATYLCVGTVVVDPHDLEPTSGRLMVFKVHTNEGKPSLHQVSSTPVRGCVYAIVSRENTLVLAVNSAVSLQSNQISRWKEGVLLRKLVFRSRYSSSWR
jgi:hypothetical protein